MAEWPGSVPRDEMLQRVVTRGKRIRLVRRLVIAGAALGVGAAGVAGYALGSRGNLDLLAESTVPMADVAVPFHACPGSGAMGALHRGDRVLLTGTDSTGRWVEVRAPEDQSDRVWVLASAVTPDERIDLPEVACGDDEAELALATGEVVTTTTTDTTVPGEETTTTTTTTTVPGPTPTTTPGPTPTTVTPTTAAPDVSPPVIDALHRSQPLIAENAAGCNEPKTSTLSARVRDAGGLAAVRLRYSFAGADGPVNQVVDMASVGGSRFEATVGPFAPNTISSNPLSQEISWTVIAVDQAGNPREVAAGPNYAVTLLWCGLN